MKIHKYASNSTILERLPQKNEISAQLSTSLQRRMGRGVTFHNLNEL